MYERWIKLVFRQKRYLHESLFVYERWYSSNLEPGWYLCFDWTQFLVFNIELRLDLGYRLLRLDSRTNLESVPRFAEIWWKQVKAKWRKNLVFASHLLKVEFNLSTGSEITSSCLLVEFEPGKIAKLDNKKICSPSTRTIKYQIKKQQRKCQIKV